MAICPMTDNDCRCVKLCNDRELCCLMRNAPIDLLDCDPTPVLHFVGFRGEEYHSAVNVFGAPDFIHKVWDHRAVADVTQNDTVVFAKYHDCDPSPYSFDDSNQLDDPAAAERIK